MIKLENSDKLIILLCKGHLQNEFPRTDKDTILNIFEKPFLKIYGWDPKDGDNYKDFMHGLFFKMYETYKLIKRDHSGSDLQMRELFTAIFYKGISNDAESPIERGINDLHSLIQNNRVINKNGTKRYDLDKTEEFIKFLKD
jgi:hypothetical protein